MANRLWNIKLISSPSYSNLGIVEGLIIKLHVPYSNDQVTVKINPNITEYRDDQSKNIRQLSISKDTDETKTLQFDFKKNNIHRINVGNKNYEWLLVKLMKQDRIFHVSNF